MPIRIPVPDVARFDVRATIEGVQVETSHCFRIIAPPITQAKLDLQCSRIRTAWQNSPIQALGSGVQWRHVFAEDLSPGSTLTSQSSHFIASGLGAPTLPASIAISLLPVAVGAPRPWQWRVRVFGVPENRVSGNMLDAVWAEQFRQFIRDRYTLQGAFGWHPVVVQRVVDGVPLSQGVPYLVTNYVVPTLVISPMRRRLR